MNDNIENILINVEKCVPTFFIMRQHSSTKASKMHFKMQNRYTQINTLSHVDQAFRNAFLKMTRLDVRVMMVSAGIRRGVGFFCHEGHA